MMDVEYVTGAPSDAPAPGLHTCYYNKFFLLKMPVEANGKRAQVKLNSKGSPVLSYCPRRGRDVDLSLSLISQNVAKVLMKHGVYHVDTFYYHDVPMFSVSFASEAKLRNFLSTERDSVQHELQEQLGSLFGRRYSYIQKPMFVKQPLAKITAIFTVKVHTDLFLITPPRCGQAPQQVDIKQVTPACVHSIYGQWHGSGLFKFGDIDALFSGTSDHRHEEREEKEAQMNDLLNELCHITRWFLFGIHLGILSERLSQIEAEHHDIQNCILKVLLEWKRQEMPKWSKVVQALIKMNYKYKAKRLAAKYGVSHYIEEVEDEVVTQTDMTKTVSDFEEFRAIQQKKQFDMKKDNDKMLELQQQYKNRVTEVRTLSDKLRKIEEQRDILIKNLQLSGLFVDIIREKEADIQRLKKELSKKKEELSEYSAQIQILQIELDKKTADYKHLSSKVAQLEGEKRDQEKRLELMQTEHEEQLQLKAAKALGADEHAKEVTRQLEDAKCKTSLLAVELRSIVQEKEQHIGEITRLQSDLQLKTEEIHKLQRKHSMAAANSTSPLTEECEEEYMQLFKLMDSASKIKLELIEVEMKKAQKLAECDQKQYEMRHLKGKLADLNVQQQCEELFSVLGLRNYYPQGLTLQHAREIREDTLECVQHLQDTSSSSADKRPMKKAHRLAPCTNPRLYPFLILQKIMAFDCTCRTKLVLSSQASGNQSIIVKALSADKYAGKNVSDYVVNPMDGLLAVLHCADNFLRQDLICRLATCQLAVPLLLPDPFEPDKVTFPLWALRSIVKEWQLPNGITREGQLACTSSPLVCFLRIGKLKVSKSHIMNIIISESKHDIFFQYNCDGGHAKKLIVNGLVEVCWYLPSERDATFSDVVVFANLHGDAQKCPKQVNFLSRVSFMNFVFIKEENRTDEALEVLKTLAKPPGGLILLQVDSSDDENIWYEWLEPVKESVQVTKLDNNEEAICMEVCEKINSKINKKWNIISNNSLEKCSDVAHLCSILVDEEEEPCMKGRKLAHDFETIISEFREKQRAKSQSRAEGLKNLLPLQGPDLWHKWAMTEKEQYRQTQRSGCEIEVYCQQQTKKMKSIRATQFSHTQSLKPLMKSFLNSLLTFQGKTRHYYLQWIRFFLDNLARDQLPLLQSQYRHKVLELQNIQSNKVSEEACKAEIQKLNKQIIDASFGLEHLLREVGQIYEAVAAQGKVSQTEMHFLHLPEVAAKLMIEGCPLELMDGDTAHLPTSWMSAVLSKVQELLHNPKLFVISVLGVQSSGKSTLLNTVFGVQFNTSAGRCTRGAFMQLLPIHKNLQQKCKCDYFLIVDTEGLRAPEFAEQTHWHDNELATFVIGLADLTITILSGETVGDMDDILQTAVHAFLRMKTVRLKPSCHFVHQNVTAVKAGEKAMIGHRRFREALDQKTLAAAKTEGLEDQFTHFTDVIDFDSTKHVFYFQNLWKGDPPMAPVNPGYSNNAQFLKLCVINLAKTADSRGLNVFQQFLKDLWKAILHENFVFSFKNTLEITAYNTLDVAYSNWSWQFKREMMTWEQEACNKMKSCEISKLSSVFNQCCTELPTHIHNVHQKLYEEMQSFFQESAQQEIIIKWKGEMELRLGNLKMQLEQQALDHSKFWKTNREALAKVDNMKETHHGYILDHVKLLASKLEKGKLNDKELEEKFNEKWTECINEIKSLPVHIVEIDVKGDVQRCLTGFERLRPSQPVVIEKLKSIPLEERVSKLHLEVTKVHVKPRPKYLIKGHIHYSSEYPLPDGQAITDGILQCQEQYLQQMKKQHYNLNLATELLRKLFDDISRNSTDVAFTEEYRIDMALTVCQYATVKFQEMVDAEKKKNDPVQYLEREVKEPFWKIFKAEYNQIAREVTAASAVCDLLQNSLKKEVIVSMSQRIADGMRGVYAFVHTKAALKAQILLDIGDELDEHSDRSFENCMVYLEDIAKSLHYWLERYTMQYCGKGKFAEIAFTEISNHVKLLTNAVHKVSMEFLQEGDEFSITEWLTQFHNDIQSTGKLHLDLTELQQIGGVHQLKYACNFTEEVKKRLRSLESTLREEFHDMPLEVINNWEEKPHNHLFEALAGCTEQCPFCKEQCDLTIPNHPTKHSVALHRPECLGGNRMSKSEEMSLQVCTTLVANDTKFRYHPYEEYAKFYSQWSITADRSLETSLYWKWLLGKYDEKIAMRFGMKRTEIPTEWKELQWKNVKEHLKDVFNI